MVAVALAWLRAFHYHVVVCIDKTCHEKWWDGVSWAQMVGMSRGAPPQLWLVVYGGALALSPSHSR